MRSTTETIFDRLGGESTINVMVDLFYRKVLTDPYINHFFKDVDMTRQVEKQKSFLRKAFDGPSQYDNKQMRRVHKHLVLNMGLNDSHFDHLISHLRSSLAEVGIDRELILEAIEVSESFRDAVLNRSAVPVAKNED